MHPSVRITCLLVFAALLPRLGMASGVAIAAALLVVHAVFFRDNLGRFLSAVVRLKWLYLAILILYLGFTPGTALVAGWDVPTIEGLSEGLFRCSVLVAILGAVHVLMAVTGREELCSGIVWLTTPLGMLGLDRERLALRLSLTLEYVAGAEQLLKDAVARRRDEGLVAVSASLIESMEQEVPETPEASTIAAAPGNDAAPGFVEWIWPIILLVSMIGLIQLP